MRLFNFFKLCLFIFIFFLAFSPLKANEDFNEWLTSYKKYAKSKGVSEETMIEDNLNFMKIPSLMFQKEQISQELIMQKNY